MSSNLPTIGRIHNYNALFIRAISRDMSVLDIRVFEKEFKFLNYNNIFLYSSYEREAI